MNDLDGKTVKFLAKAMKAIDSAIMKIKMKLDHGENWTSEESLNVYTTVCDVCLKMKSWDTSPENYVVERIYHRYDLALQERTLEKVIPSLENKEGMALLRELMKAWSQYKHYAQHLMIMFHYLKHYTHVSPPYYTSITELLRPRFCHPVWNIVALHNRIDQALSLLMINSGAFDEKSPIDEASKCLARDVNNFFNEVVSVPSDKLQSTIAIWKIIKASLTHLGIK